MTITEFLLARIAEREEAAKKALATDWMDEQPTFYEGVGAHRDDWGLWTFNVPPDRVLARCKADRAIVEFHQSWPVLVQQEPTFDLAESTDPSRAAYRMSQRIQWMTEQEYRTRFGDEPPTAPMLRALAAVYADHPDYDTAWGPDGA